MNPESPTLQNAMNGGLVHRSASRDSLGSLALVHVGRFATDVRCVGFRWPVHFGKRPRFHRLSDSVQHEPSGFLRHADGTPEFVAADSVLRVGDTPDRHEPLVQSERGIFKDGIDLVAELLLARLDVALQLTARLQHADAIRAALGANGLALRPLDPLHILVADVKVREVTDSGEQRCWKISHSTGLCDIIACQGMEERTLAFCASVLGVVSFKPSPQAGSEKGVFALQQFSIFRLASLGDGKVQPFVVAFFKVSHHAVRPVDNQSSLKAATMIAVVVFIQKRHHVADKRHFFLRMLKSGFLGFFQEFALNHQIAGHLLCDIMLRFDAIQAPTAGAVLAVFQMRHRHICTIQAALPHAAPFTLECVDCRDRLLQSPSEVRVRRVFQDQPNFVDGFGGCVCVNHILDHSFAFFPDAFYCCKFHGSAFVSGLCCCHALIIWLIGSASSKSVPLLCYQSTHVSHIGCGSSAKSFNCASSALMTVSHE